MKITIKDQTPLCSEYKVIVVGSVGIEKVNFELDETWENLQVFACFKNSNLKEEYSQFLSNSNEVYIPWEVLTVPGTLFIGVLGMDGERIIKPTIWKEVAKVREGTSTDGVASEEHSETALEQVVALAQSVRDDADAGKFDGTDGISPTVSVEDIDGGHRVTITDKDGDNTFDVMDGKDGEGGSGVSSWNDLTDKPFGTEQAFEPIQFFHDYDNQVFIKREQVDLSPYLGEGFVFYKLTDNFSDARIFDNATFACASYTKTLKRLVADGLPSDISFFSCGIEGYDADNDSSFTVVNLVLLACVGGNSFGIPRGLYSTYPVGESYAGGSGIQIYKEIVNPLDGKYLPPPHNTLLG